MDVFSQLTKYILELFFVGWHVFLGQERLNLRTHVYVKLGDFVHQLRVKYI